MKRKNALNNNAGAITGRMSLHRGGQEAAAGAYALREVAKAHATRKLAGRRKWRGLDISLEQDVGDIRRGVAPDGTPWETKMTAPYGYVKGAEGVDGDHLDVFVNPDSDEGENVYVVHTIKPDGTYDEDKCFCGFASEADAVRCFNSHYDKPENHFGALTVMKAEDFVAHCKGGRENWGKSLGQRIGSKINLTRRKLRAAEKAQEAHREWLLGVLANEDKADHALEDEVKASPVYREMEKAISRTNAALSQSQLEIVEDPAYAGRRVLRIQPHMQNVDLLGEITPLEVLQKAWPYYEACGNFDLEHATKSAGENLSQVIAALRMRGLNPKVQNGKISYEIGRPIKGSFNPQDGSYLVEIYSGESEFAEAANWFWNSLTKTNPPVPWKTSIAGKAAYVDVIVDNVDKRLNVSIKNMRAEQMTYFRWDNTAATLQGISQWSLPVQVVSPRNLQLQGGRSK